MISLLSLSLGLDAGSMVALFFWILGSSLGAPSGMITMIVIGSLAQNFSTLLLIMLVSFSAAVIGDMLAYEIARKLSPVLSSKLKNMYFFRKNEEKARTLLNKHGFYIVFFTRFALVNLCAVVSYICGFEKLNRKKFLFAVVSGEFLYAVIYPLIGFAVGETFSTLLTAINEFIIAGILIILVLYILKVFLPKIHRKIKSIWE